MSSPAKIVIKVLRSSVFLQTVRFLLLSLKEFLRASCNPGILCISHSLPYLLICFTRLALLYVITLSYVFAIAQLTLSTYTKVIIYRLYDRMQFSDNLLQDFLQMYHGKQF